MALTFTPVKDESPDYFGATPVTVFDITMDNAYPAGGYVVVGANVGLRLLLGMHLIGGNAAALGLYYHWRTDTGKLQAIFPSGGGAAAPVTLANAAIAAGAVAVNSVAANGATDLVPGIGVEVGNGANLSTITARFLIFGQR